MVSMGELARPIVLFEHITSWRASEASETLAGSTKSKIAIWRASEASETLAGTTKSKIAIFICVYVWYVCHSSRVITCRRVAVG